MNYLRRNLTLGEYGDREHPMAEKFDEKELVTFNSFLGIRRPPQPIDFNNDK